MIPIPSVYEWNDAEAKLPPVFEPEDVETCRTWIKEKHQKQAAVLLVGGGSHSFLGNPPRRTTDILSLRKWDRVLEYSPGDLTVSVEAGCPLSRLNEVLGRAGQFLPFFPVNHREASIGGLVSSGLSGRYEGSLGGIRNYLIGIEVLHPEGILSRAGGKVVKNVAGYDLCKLYTGAMGSLGVITQLTFKVRPRPARSQTTVIAFSDFAKVVEAVVDIRNRIDPAALDLISAGELEPQIRETLPSDQPLLLAVQVWDSDALTTWKLDELRRQYASAHLLDKAEEQQLWDSSEKAFVHALRPKSGVTVLRIGTPLSRLDEVHGQLSQRIPHHAISGHLRDGTLFLFTTEPEALLELEKLRREWLDQQVYGIVFKNGFPRGTGSVDVWGPTSQPLDIMRRIKKEFDPNAILNPGRFWGGL